FGSGIGMTVGAVLVHLYGWRTTLYIAGIPGLLVVLILLFTVKEPKRLTVHGGADLGGTAPPLRQTLRFIAGQRSLLHLGAAITLLLTSLLGFGIGPLLTGSISDYFAPSVGVMSVGYGMVGANLLALWGGLHFMLAGRTLRRDLDSVPETPVII